MKIYLKDLLVLENELEDTRIRLATERDFYPKVCFKAFLATAESKDLQRREEDSNGKPSDGLSELEATSDSIYEFIRDNAQTSLGMCSRTDLESLLREFMTQRMQGIPVEELRPN